MGEVHRLYVLWHSLNGSNQQASSEDKNMKADQFIVSGFSSRRLLLLDLDHTTEYKVRKLADMILAWWPDLLGYVVMLSSEGRQVTEVHYRHFDGTRQEPYVSIGNRGNFHVIFDGYVPFEKVRARMHVLAELDVVQRRVFTDIATFRNSLTLRIGSRIAEDKVRGVPQIVSSREVFNEDDVNKGGIDEYFDQLRTFEKVTQ